MSWVKNGFLISKANNKAFLAQLIFGGCQMNDNLILSNVLRDQYISICEVLRGPLRDVQDATQYNV